MSKQSFHLITKGNSKLSKDNIYSFSLPAGFSCPQAGACAKFCYAKKGRYVFPNVANKYKRNFEIAKNEKLFYAQMCEDINRARNITALRIHASGDFFNLKYLRTWLRIAQTNKAVTFYAYTKSVGMMKKEMQYWIDNGYRWPSNLTIIFSLGGKQDSHISENNDRHSKIFANKQDLLTAGYIDVSEHDIGAFGPHHKIGLIKH